MAKILNPLNSQDARGKCGDLIYGGNNAGPWVKAYNPPEDVPTQFQTDWRTAFGELLAAWADPAIMSLENLQNWYHFAATYQATDKFGRPYTRQARDWFLSLSIHHYFRASTFNKNPPRGPQCSYFPVLSFSQDSSGIWGEFDVHPTADQCVFVANSLAQNISRRSCPSRLFHNQIVDSNSDDPFLLIDNADLSPDLKRYFFKIRAVDGYHRPSTDQILYFDCEAEAPADRICYLTNCVYIDGNHPDDNYSAIEYLQLRNLSGQVLSGLCNCDLGATSPNFPCISAKLYFYCFYRQSSDTVYVYPSVTSNYTKSEVTWNKKNSSTSWNSPGLNPSTDYNVLLYGYGSFASTGWGYLECTDLVNLYLDGTIDPDFWFLKAPTDGTLYQLKTIIEGETDYRPYFEIKFS